MASRKMESRKVESRKELLFVHPPCTAQDATTIMDMMKGQRFEGAQFKHDSARSLFRVTCRPQDAEDIRALFVAVQESLKGSKKEGAVGSALVAVPKKPIESAKPPKPSALPATNKITKIVGGTPKVFNVPASFPRYRFLDVWIGLCLSPGRNVGDVFSEEDLDLLRKEKGVDLSYHLSGKLVHLGSNEEASVVSASKGLDVLLEGKTTRFAGPAHVFSTESIVGPDFDADARYVANIHAALLRTTLFDQRLFHRPDEAYPKFANAIALRLCVFDAKRDHYVSLFGPPIRQIAPQLPGSKKQPAASKRPFGFDKKMRANKSRGQSSQQPFPAVSDAFEMPPASFQTDKSDFQHDSEDLLLAHTSTVEPNKNEQVNSWLGGMPGIPPATNNLSNAHHSSPARPPPPASGRTEDPAFLPDMVARMSRIVDDVRSAHAKEVRSAGEDRRLVAELDELKGLVKQVSTFDQSQGSSFSTPGAESSQGDFLDPRVENVYEEHAYTGSLLDGPIEEHEGDAPIPQHLLGMSRLRPMKQPPLSVSKNRPTAALPAVVSKAPPRGVQGKKDVSRAPQEPHKGPDVLKKPDAYKKPDGDKKPDADKTTNLADEMEKICPEERLKQLRDQVDKLAMDDDSSMHPLIDLEAVTTATGFYTPPAASLAASGSVSTSKPADISNHLGEDEGVSSILDMPVPDLPAPCANYPSTPQDSGRPRVADEEEALVLKRTMRLRAGRPPGDPWGKKKTPEVPEPVGPAWTLEKGTVSPKLLAAPPCFIREMEEAVSKLVAKGPYLRGTVDLRADFGRFLLYSVDESGLSFNPEGTESSGWTKTDLAAGMRECKDTSFTKVITTAGNDIEFVARMRHLENGKPLWSPNPTNRTIYSFACAVGEDKKKQFFLDIDGTDEKFSYSLRPRRDFKNPVWVHGLLHNWDLRLVMAHTDTALLESAFGAFARSMVDNLEVKLAEDSDEPRVRWHIHKDFSVEVKYMRTLTKWRFVSPDGSSHLDVTEVLDNQMRDCSMPAGPKGQNQWISQMAQACDAQTRAAREKQGWPDRWYEMSVSSATARGLFVQNEQIGFAEKAEWDFAALNRAGVLRDVFVPALRMLQQMDSVGGGNNNHQVSKMVLPRPNYELVPTSKPDDFTVRKNFLGPFW